MEADARERFLDHWESAVLQAVGFSAGVENLGGFENLVYAEGNQVLRVTHIGHRSRAALEGELAFIAHLADNGCDVCRALPLAGGGLVGEMDDFLYVLFSRARGDVAAGAAIHDIAPAWGAAIGRFHRLAAGFECPYPRPDWRTDPNHDFVARIPPQQERVLAQGAALLAGLTDLPTPAGEYGLIHGDAHPGNFLVDHGRPVFFDFDDAIHAWFAYDIATILFGVVLDREVALERNAQADAAARFLDRFLAGYATEAVFTRSMAAQMPLLLKLREFSLYAVIHLMMDVDNITEWFPARFMQGRQRMLEENTPFLDLDFSRWAV